MNGRRSHEFYDEVNTADYGLSKVFSGIDAPGAHFERVLPRFKCRRFSILTAIHIFGNRFPVF